MRKLTQASTALLLTGATAAMAAGVDSSFGEARLYWHSSFGEQSSQPITSQVGMSLDYDRRYLPQSLTLEPAARVSFDRSGFVSASVNGLPFARRVSLQQTEGEGEAESAAGTTYTAVDYGLLVIGALGIGYGISEVVDQKDSSDTGTASPSPGPAPSPSPGPAPGNCLPLPPPLNLCSPGVATAESGYRALELRIVGPDSQAWLDGGTGGMGDLVLIKD